MWRRLDLAMTLVVEPRIIFLDEPTTGLDPRSRHMMWNVIRGLARSGVTIFLTTQYLEEADQLADRMALLDKGALVASGTGVELKRLVPGGHVTLELSDPAAMGEAGGRLANATSDGDGLTLLIPSDGSVKSLRDTLALLDETIEISDLSIHTPNLDDVFFALTGGANTKEDTP